MFLFENELSDAIKNILKKESDLYIAVAFIGDEASQWINPNAKNIKIICNLTMGGTNPAEVKEIMNKFGIGNIKQIDNLHAKLYIGSEHVIVGSANMSNNGLGTQPNALREAGYKFKRDQPSGQRSLDWFYKLWESAHPITHQDLKDAAEKWSQRDRVRNGNWKSHFKDICKYNFERNDFPLITWYKNYDNSISEKLKEGRSEKEVRELEEKIYHSIDIECQSDLQHLTRGRCILMYQQTKAGLVAKKSSGLTVYKSHSIIVEQAYHLDDEPNIDIDVMLCDEVDPIFGLNQQPIYEKFRNLINQDKYRLLRDYENGENCWFHPRIELMRQFWKELQGQICQK